MSVALTYSNQELRLFQAGGGGFRYARVALPEGLVQMGRINDPNLFSQFILQAMASATPGPIRAKELIIGLPEEQSFIKTLEMPAKMSQSELRTAVEYQWQGILPITSDQVYFDCDYLKEDKKLAFKKGDRKTRSVLIVAYPKDIINTLLAALAKSGIKPAYFVPLSFGLATLFSHKDTTSMLLDSPTGQDVSVSLIRQGTSLFSTTIHATADDPKLFKQLENIKLFYEKNIGGKANKIGSSIILPSSYAPILAQQLTQVKIPVEAVDLQKFFPHQAQSENFIPFLGLAGLIKKAPSVSILPPEMNNGKEIKKQLTAYRTILVSMATTLAIMTYVSFVFLVSLEFNDNTRIRYAKPLTDRITADGERIQQEVKSVNALIARLAPLGDKRSQFSSLIDTIYTQATANQLTVTQVTYNNDQTIRIQAKVNNQALISGYIAALKTNPKIDQIKQEIPQSLLPAQTITFDLTLTIKAGL